MTTASEPTSALLHVRSSFSVRLRICQTSRLVRSQPPTAFSEKSTLKHYCLVRHSPVFITGLFPGGFDPSYLSFTNVCLAMVVCCFSSRVVWPVSCTLRVVTASSCSSGMLCVSLRPWLHVPVFCNAMGVASGELLSSLSFVSHDGLSGAAPLV